MSSTKTPKLHLAISDLFPDENNFLEELKEQEINQIYGSYMKGNKSRKYCCRGYLKFKGFLNAIKVIVND